MPDAFVPLVALAPLFLFLAALSAFSYVLRKRRSYRMRKAAAELGLAFARVGDAETKQELACCQLLSCKFDGDVRNLMYGTSDGLVVKVFDNEFGSERGGERAVQTVVAFRSPELALPAFTVRPKRLFHRLAALFGYQDILFANRPTFTSRYLLRGKDEKAVRRLFDDAVVSLFERGGNTFSAEGDGAWFILFRPGEGVKPEYVRYFLQEGFEVLA